MTRYAGNTARARKRARRSSPRALLCALGAGLLALAAAGTEPLLGQTKPPKRPASKAKPSPEKGHGLFINACAGCHGATAQGGDGPSLHALKLTDDQIVKTIKGGRKGQMPAFGSRFKDAELKDIVAYLRSLK
ncbi:MAG TPA: cytochrome c [Chthonomonadaceae bacterium]|nr:cytochrome c [Chthonomonadaceae bacterium]